MKVEYKVLPATDEFVQLKYDLYDADEVNALVKYVDNKPVEVLALDGGEPEDNSFVRDWSWVPTALERAFKQGYEYGYERAVPRDALDI